MIRTAALILSLSFTSLVLTPGEASAQSYYQVAHRVSGSDYGPGYYWPPNIYVLPYYSNFVTQGFYTPPGNFYSVPGYSRTGSGYYYSTSGYAIPQATAPSTVVPYSSADKARHIAWVKTLLPTADAEVWLSGSRGTLQGTERLFQSPQLMLGQDYTYTIRARWMIDGRPVEDVREVDVRAGQTSTVDFRVPASELIPIPPKLK